MNLNELARDIHTANVEAGWWDGFSHKSDRFDTAMMLTVSELSEAMEGYRKDLMDDHLPHHKMFDVELADTMIRLLDLAGAWESDLSRIDLRVKHEGYSLRQLAVPEQLYRAVRAVASGRFPGQRITDGIANVIAIAEHNGIDLWALVEEKRAYNAVRADHKLSARNAKGGKKF